MKNNISYGEVMEVYSRPISIRYIPRIFVCIFILTVAFISKPVLAELLQLYGFKYLNDKIWT